jgi:hypothetical protein
MRPRLPVFVGREHENFEEIYASFIKPLHRLFLFCILWFLGLTVFIFCINTIDLLRPVEESIGSWFERSGALIGVCGMLVEFKLKTVDNILGNASMAFKPDVYQSFGKYEKYKSYMHVTALTYAIVGAIIWSYGSPVLVWINHLLLWVNN